MTTTTIHKWEAQGLGKAPYQLCELLETPQSVDLLNPSYAIQRAKEYGVGLGCCDVCGMGITECYVLRSRDGKFFIVGCDCVLKMYGDDKNMTDRDPLVREVKRKRNEIRTRKRHEREDAKIAAGVALIPSLEARLKKQVHPNSWRAEKGETMLDWVNWMLLNSGRCGKIKVARFLQKESEKVMLEMPKTRQQWERVWQQFNRMQRRVMADKTTKKEFFAQPPKERWEFYNWLQNQCGSFSCYI